MEERDDVISRIFALGQRFQQRLKTIHIAVELMDRYFLDQQCPTRIDSRKISIFLTTCFLIASKLDEIDDRLVFVNDVQKYYKTTKYAQVMPTWGDVVETERHILKFFDWSISFPLPVHFLEMFLAQGVLFQSDSGCDAETLSLKCYKLLNETLHTRYSLKNAEGWLPSQVATFIIFKTRDDMLDHPWNPELEIITKCNL